MASREITTLSSAEERARAAEQLRAAQTEYNNALKSLPSSATLSDYDRIGREIASRYDYVDFSNGSQPTSASGPLQITVSPGDFFVKGYGTNAEFETYKSPTASNRDDAYVSPGSTPTSSQTLRDSTNNQAAREPSGSSAADAPGLSGSSTTPVSGGSTAQTGSPAASDNGSGPNPANTTPVTQNGDSASTGGAGGSNYNAREGDGSASSSTGSNAATGRDDDASSTGGTGTGSNSGNSTGGSTDGSNNGSNNNGVSVKQAGQGSYFEDLSKRGTQQNKRILQRPNPLHNYVNWTYQVGWYMMDTKTFNEFTANGRDSASLRRRPLMRSGGFVKKGQGFDFDLHLVNLRMRNVIGNTSSSPGSNIYEIEMQVMEPYGVSLIQKLKELAGDNDDPFNIPYLLEIKWLGYDEKGSLINNIPDSGPKLVPAKIINITFNIDSAGTVYTITMAPYAQAAIDRIDGVLRQNLNLYGDSLQTLLQEGPDCLREYLNKKAQGDVRECHAEYADEYNFEIVSFDSGTRTRNNKLATAPITFPQKGGSATQLSQRGTGNPADRAAGIASTPGLAAQLTQRLGGNPADIAAGIAGTPGLSDKTNDPSKQYFSFTSGTTIVAAIVDMAKNSKYFQDLMSEVPNSDKERPLELIKVVPVITELGKYDNSRRTYQKKITYKIMSYFDYGRMFPYGGQARVDKRGFVKEYNWLFTGKNDDILDLRLNLDLMYYQIMTKSPAEKAALNTSSVPAEKVTTKNSVKTTDSLYAPQKRTGPGDPNTKGPKTQNVNDAFDYALNSPRKADLVTLDLDIIGDPDWITQDRSVRPKGNDINANNSGYVDNDFKMGVAVDVDSVYVKFLFRTPRDYSDTTGLMNLTVDQTLISGVYKVISVESKFENGRFTQTLGLVRTEVQEENKPTSAAIKSPNREDSLSSVNKMADARQQDRLSVPGYLSPIQSQAPAERDKFSSLGDPVVAQALYRGEPNQAVPTNRDDAAIQNFFLGTNNNPSLGDDRGR